MSSSEILSTVTEQEKNQKPSLRKALIFGLVISAVVFILGVVSLSLSSQHKSSQATASLATTSLKVGAVVPTFSLPGVNVPGSVGIPTLSSLVGRPAVLVFFASWCGPCKTEMPKLAAAIAAGDASHALIIGIAAYDHPNATKAFIKSNHVTFSVGNDSSGQVTSGVFGFPAVPETVFVNARGIVTSVHFGATSPAVLRTGLAS